MIFAKKSLGQNFLMHQATAARIADAAGISSSDTVLEIGPGTGMLTRELLARAGNVIAVEADGALAETLASTFATEIAAGKLMLIHQDIRGFDPASINGGYRLVANIPYYITGELLRQFLSASHKPESMTVLVQKEVAVRLARQTGKTAKESLLSLSVKVYGTPSIEFSVPRGAFVPAPNVDSAVLSIRDIKSPFAGEDGEEGFFRVLRAGFAHKRKRLMKNLEEGFGKEAVADAFAEAGLGENIRAEDVALPVWIALSGRLAI